VFSDLACLISVDSWLSSVLVVLPLACLSSALACLSVSVQSSFVPSSPLRSSELLPQGQLLGLDSPIHFGKDYRLL